MDGTPNHNPYPDLDDDFGEKHPPINQQLSKYTTKDYAGFLKNNVNISRPPNANEINNIDDFGFVKVDAPTTTYLGSKQKVVTEEQVKKIKKRENARMEKWRSMLVGFPKKQHKKLKSRTKKGIPDCYRGYVWIMISHARNLIESNQGVYEDLLCKKATINEESIIKDITRTFPKHVLFKDSYGEGQKSLFDILKCLAIYMPDTGYVQGMGFMCALFLTYMEPKEAFWLMVAVLDRYELKEFYLPNMPALAKSFYKHVALLKEHFPKLYKHFRKIKYEPSIYAAQWFLTSFTVNFPFEISVRVWDCFFVDGMRSTYRISLAIFKLLYDKLLKLELEDTVELVKNFMQEVDPDVLIRAAYSISVTQKRLDALEKDYKTNPNGEILAFIQ